jgi:hypothetical protein
MMSTQSVLVVLKAGDDLEVLQQLSAQQALIPQQEPALVQHANLDTFAQPRDKLIDTIVQQDLFMIPITVDLVKKDFTAQEVQVKSRVQLEQTTHLVDFQHA